MYTRIGIVTTRPGAKLHLVINGRAFCGSGSGRILGQPRDITAADDGHLCRRCVPALERQMVLDLATVGRRRDTGSVRAADALNRMLDTLTTPATAVVNAATLTTIADRIAAANLPTIVSITEPRPVGALI